MIRRYYRSFLLVLVSSLLLVVAMGGQAWADSYSQEVKASISSVSSKSLTVKWSAPAEKQKSGSTLYLVKGSKKQKVKSLPADCRKYKIKKLKKGKAYKYQVVTRNAAGKRFYSNVVSSKTSSAKKSRNATRIKLSRSKVSMKEGQRTKITAKAYAKGGKSPISRSIKYYSTNNGVATVSSSGEIVGVSFGNCRIYCVAHNGLSSFVEVSVLQGVLVLGYHGVATPSKKEELYPADPYTITTTEFERQIKFLYGKGYRSLTCDEFYKWQTGKVNLPKKSVLITFDDGRYSAVKNAPEILDKYDMKSTWFVIGERSDKSNGDNPNRYTATADDLREMAAGYHGCELQGHSYGLHDVDKNRKALIFSKTQADVEEDCVNLKIFAQKLGLSSFDYYAYPYGRDPVWYQNGLKASGYKMAFDYGSDALATRQDNRWSVNRVGIRSDTTWKRFSSFVR